MSSIFISYSRKDIEFARKIVEALAENNLDTWIDWHSIPKGEDWEQEIYRGIESAEAFLFLVSPDSIQSEMCNKEIAHAKENNKRIIPIVIRDANPDKFLFEISRDEIKRRNWFFCRDQSNELNKAIEEIVETIHTDYEWLKYHTKLQLRMLEWERSNHENSFLLRGKELQDAEIQLATNSSKEPLPTDSQREYVLKSRQVADQQRRLLTSISVAMFMLLAALAIFGFVQAGLATERGNTAQTAQANAESNQKLAEKQANIALARQLAAQAQSIHATENSKQIIAVLLAVHSMQLFPLIDSAQVLQNNTSAYPIARMTHDSGVNSVAFSPDGKYIVSGSVDKTARIWEATTGKEVARMIHDDVIYSVAFNPEGKYVVSGSADKTARVWETTTGKEVARIIHDDVVYSVAFSPDGKYVVSGSADKTARVWEATTGREVARIIHAGDVTSVAFSPNGKDVVSGSLDKTVRIWEVATGKEVARMIHDDDVWFVTFSPDGKYVVVR